MAEVVIVAHHERPEARELVRVAVDWLTDRGHKAWMPPEEAAAIGCPELGEPRPPGDADVAISFGGDGTMLRTVELVSAAGVPIIGVNVGVLGYLPEVEPAELTQSLARWLSDRYHIEERMMLSVAARRADGSPIGPVRHALNEAVIEKSEVGHTVRILVRIEGADFTPYVADGLIIATPTGSTAYALSARGPIISPRHRCLLLAPVAPHMLFDRPLVLSPEESLELEIAGHRRAQLAIDGQGVATLYEGDTVSCAASPHVARLIRFGQPHFHQILKAKFGLNDR